MLGEAFNPAASMGSQLLRCHRGALSIELVRAPLPGVMERHVPAWIAAGEPMASLTFESPENSRYRNDTRLVWEALNDTAALSIFNFGARKCCSYVLVCLRVSVQLLHSSFPPLIQIIPGLPAASRRAV